MSAASSGSPSGNCRLGAAAPDSGGDLLYLLRPDAFQTLIKLRENQISAREISRALESLREKLEWVKQPLSELRVVSDGGRIAVHVAGQKMEAISGQILLRFRRRRNGRHQELSRAQAQGQPHCANPRSGSRKGWNSRRPARRWKQAVDAYQKVLELNPGAAGALVNLGTIYYRMRKFDEAEKYYLAAIEADPAYPLAQFNLGNLYDEQGRLPEALDYYRRALALNPHYADAHFNLALLCERQGDAMKAVHHWKAYLKLDIPDSGRTSPAASWNACGRR